MNTSSSPPGLRLASAVGVSSATTLPLSMTMPREHMADLRATVPTDSGAWVEDKGAAFAVHYRTAPDPAAAPPDADPPPANTTHSGQHRHDQQKNDKQQRKRAHKVELKELRFRPNTDDHDFDFKTKHAREFLEEGNQVKAWVQFRGRDIIYKERGANLLSRFIETLSDISRVEQLPKMEGRRMTVMLTPDKSAKKG